MVDQSDPDHPFVWKDAGGKLKKQQVTITDTMEEIGKVKISEGLELADSIAIPDGTLSEGMKTAPMSEKPDAGAAEGDEEYSGEESYEPQETGIEEGEFIEDTMPEVVPEGIGVEGIGVEGIGN